MLCRVESQLIGSLTLPLHNTTQRVLDAAAVSALSRLVYNVFQPSLLFTNVMQTLAAPSSGGQSKATLLLLPLAAALQILVASIVSAGVIRLANIPPDSEEGRETRVCSTFANSGKMDVPYTFLETLPGPCAARLNK